jgi:hypothetical protein
MTDAVQLIKRKQTIKETVTLLATKDYLSHLLTSSLIMRWPVRLPRLRSENIANSLFLSFLPSGLRRETSARAQSNAELGLKAPSRNLPATAEAAPSEGGPA